MEMFYNERTTKLGMFKLVCVNFTYPAAVAYETGGSKKKTAFITSTKCSILYGWYGVGHIIWKYRSQAIEMPTLLDIYIYIYIVILI